MKFPTAGAVAATRADGYGQVRTGIDQGKGC